MRNSSSRCPSCRPGARALSGPTSRSRTAHTRQAPAAPDTSFVAIGLVRLAPAERRMRSRGPARPGGIVAVDEGRPAARRERDSASVGVQRGVTVGPSLRWRWSWSVCLHPNCMGQHRSKCRAAGGWGVGQ
jgi:hypothetical protein